MSENKCSDCNKEFKDKSDLSRHLKISHNESLVEETSECKNCNESFAYYPSNKKGKYCSDCTEECWVNLEKEKYDVKCEHCKEEKEVSQTSFKKNDKHFCNEDCRKRYIRDKNNIIKINQDINDKKDFIKFLIKEEIKEQKLSYKGRTYLVEDCDWCGVPHMKRKDTVSKTKNSFCDRWCESRYKSSAIIKNRTDIKDSFHWFLLREKAWERDEETCQNCGKPKGVLNRKPEVTVIYNKLDHTLENVVCLCLDCKDKIKRNSFRLKAAKKSEVTISTDMFLCPHKDCSKSSPASWFDTERAMKIHHGSKHSKSISKVERECSSCSSTFKCYQSRNRSNCNICKLEKSSYNIDQCHSCDEKFISLGQHWVNSECDYPKISEEVIEILTGMVMGDATVYNHNKSSEKCSIKWSMINEEFIKWLDEKIGYITLGEYQVYRTPEESAREVVKSGLAEEANPNNYSTMYSNMTRSHPDFKWFGEWYDDNGNKKFPLEEIELTPLTLKVWYVCDGSLGRSNPTPRPRISCKNEKDRIEDIVEFIDVETGIKPSALSEGRILFGSGESEEFFDYVGEPLPGFEYKWS